MRWRWARAGAAFAAILTQPVFAAEPAEVLAQASEAARTQNFQGVVIYRDEQHLEALRVVHRFSNDHESERVTSLNGEPREIFREDERIFCILPKDRMLRLERPALKGFLSQITPERLAEIGPWYEFRSLGTQRVAGRVCEGVAVTPRDQYRYGYELWADQQTRIPLKFSLIGSDRRVIEQVMFTEVSFPASIPDEAFQTDVNTARSQVVSHTDSPAPPMEPVAGGDPRWNFAQMPPGFRIVMHDEQDLPDGSGRVAHTLLTDGLSTISVFSDAAFPRDRSFSRDMGALQAYGRVVGSYHITIVGEAPARTIRLIGDGVRPAPKD